MQKQVAGIIVVSEILNMEIIEYLNKTKIPFVYLNKYYNVLESPTVSIDNFDASEKVMKYLIDGGHKKIAYVSQGKDIEITIEKEKIEAYTKWMHKINESPIILSVDGYDISTGYKLGNQVKDLMEKEGVTALYCCEDEVALGVINCLYDHHIKIPEDISIIGYGDTKLASVYRPALTTIKEPYYDIGAVSIRKILKQLQGEKTERQTIVLPVQLIIRASSSIIKDTI